MRRKGLRRIFAAMLVCAVVGTSAETKILTLYAQEPASESSGEEIVVEERYFSAAEVQEIAEEAFGAGGTLISGTAEKYIDRVELAEGVKEVYTTLENHTDWLIDPTSMGVTFPYGGVDYYCLEGIKVSDSDDADEISAQLVTAYAAFLRDHPEVFWLNGTVSRITSGQTVGGVTTYTVYLVLKSTDDVRDLDHYADKAAIEAAIADRDTYIGQIKTEMNTELDASAFTYDKLKFLHNWLTKNNRYNSTAATAPNAVEYRQAHQCISALASSASDPKKYGDPVCEGYAKAFKVLCDQENIPCVLIDGTGITGIGSEAHMWNAVKISDAWYAVDATWDDPTVTGVTTYISGQESQAYFLVGSDTEVGGKKFSDTHNVMNQVTQNGIAFTNGPVLSTTAYDSASHLETITEINVETGKEAWNKTYGDTFSLEGISNTADAPMTYHSEDTNVATVDADGKVTITGVGTTKITVSVATNSGVWTAASREITVTGTKADGANAPNSTISQSYRKNKKVKDVALGSDWSWKSTDADKALVEGGKVTATAVYKHDEKNYNTVSVEISMSTCPHTGNTKVNNRKAATCTAAGYTGDTVCQDCGKTIQTGSTIAALGHSYTSTVTKQPTEDAEGVRTYTCSRCGNTYTEKIAKLPKTDTQTDTQTVTQSDMQSEASSVGTWKEDGGRWWYENGDGSYPSNGWAQIGDTWYAFDAAGYMQTGWYQSGGAWYYLSADGSMITGWTNQGGTWYYLEDSGAMAVGWRQLDGIWYYFAGSGAMEIGWQLIGGTWYYFADSGAMTTGWSAIGGTWYYFGDGGAMSVGWQKIGTTWYYFYGSGAMAANTTIGGYRLRADGSMQ